MDEGGLRHDGNDQKSGADFSIAKAIHFRYCERHTDLSDRIAAASNAGLATNSLAYRLIRIC